MQKEKKPVYFDGVDYYKLKTTKRSDSAKKIKQLLIKKGFFVRIEKNTAGYTILVSSKPMWFYKLKQ